LNRKSDCKDWAGAGQQRIWIVEIDRDSVFPLDFNPVFVFQTESGEKERSKRAKSKLAVPGPLHVFGGEFVAPVALDTLTQLEANELAAGVEFKRLRELALNGEAGGQVWMIGSVLAESAWLLRVWNLFELKQIVVENRDRLEGAEAHVEVAVETLWRSRRGNHQRVGGSGRGANQSAR